MRLQYRLWCLQRACSDDYSGDVAEYGMRMSIVFWRVGVEMVGLDAGVEMLVGRDAASAEVQC